MQKTRSSFSIRIAVFLLAFAVGGTAFAEVSVQVRAGQNIVASASFINNTGQAWRLGGIRYTTSGGRWNEVESWLSSHIVLNNNPDNEVEIYYKSTAPSDNAALLRAGSTASLNHVWSHPNHASLLPRADTEIQLLLKTGAPGIPDDPISHPSITCDELESLVGNTNFYSRTFRHASYDSLGSNGGRYSGGFINTYVGRTQIHFAIPTGNAIRGAAAVRGPVAPAYYMSLAMGQELLNVDAQWMFAMGAKESWSGTTVDYGDTWNGQNIWWSTGNQAVGSGNFSSWHVEDQSGNDRALNYPHAFPLFSGVLSQARDVTTYLMLLARPENAHLIPAGAQTRNALMRYYIGGYDARTHPRSINGLFVSAMFQYVNYDVLAYSTDICWKYALANARDPLMGLSAMLAAYNCGMWGEIPKIKAALDNTNLQSTINNPNSRELFCPGNHGNYREEILDVAQALTNASRDFTLGDGRNSEIIDFEISQEMLLEMFFGRGGTVARQGDGGLLLHYYDPAVPGSNHTAVRQRIWDDLTCAFNFLKGRAPNAAGTGSVGAERISFRYDFLSAIRTVKAVLPLERRFVPNGDASTLVPQNSTTGCAVETGGTVDEIYPRITEVRIAPDENVCILFVRMTDNVENRLVRWTLDSSWALWNSAEMLESAAGRTNNFRIVVPKEMADLFGRTIWIMAEDAAGNSVVIKRQVSFNALFRHPTMVSAAVFDTTGNGYPNVIRAVINRTNDFNNLATATYVWTWGSSANQTAAANVVTADGNNLTIRIQSTEGAANNGRLTMRYSFTENGETSNREAYIAIIDSCGPALLRRGQNPASSADGDAHFYPSNGEPGQFDTLRVQFTEPVTGVLTDSVAAAFNSPAGDLGQLEFKSATSERPLIARRARDLGNNRWEFLFTPNGNSITDGNGTLQWDSVRVDVVTGDMPATIGFNANDITDASPARNRALMDTNSVSGVRTNRSQFVPIIDHTRHNPPLVPRFVSAYMFDSWGAQMPGNRLDGRGDSLVVTLKLEEAEGAYNTRHIDHVEVVFAGQQSENGTFQRITDSTFRYIDRTLTSGSGTGTVRIIFASGDVVEGNIVERIAPVITWASYRRYEDRPDTLRVVFSEGISASSTTLPLNVGALDGNARSQHLLTRVRPTGNTAAGDTIVYALANGNLNYGDHIWINTCGLDAPHCRGITDLAGNEQTNLNNQRVRISDYFRFVRMNIESASYLDLGTDTSAYTPDGYIDQIRVVFNLGDAANNLRYIEGIMGMVSRGVNSYFASLPFDRHFNAITTDSISVPERNVFAIAVSQDRNRAERNTAVSQGERGERFIIIDSVTFADDTLGIFLDANVQIRDAMAPVIVSAVYRPKQMENDNDPVIDTLHIFFSENIAPISLPEAQRAFRGRIGASGNEFEFNITGIHEQNANNIKLLVELGYTDHIPTGGDFIRIQRDGGIRDNVSPSNVQDRNTVWMPLEVGQVLNNYRIEILPNPYAPKAMLRNQLYIAYLYDSLGISLSSGNMVVLASPIGGRGGTDLSGRITIIDGLGNIIIEDGIFAPVSSGSAGLLWTWDGKNSRGRTVGAGNYLAIITLTNNREGNTQVFRRTIGISRE